VRSSRLVYLEPEMVHPLGREIRDRKRVSRWIFDLVSPAIRRMMQRSFASKLAESATFRFAPEDGLAFFETLGFEALDVVSMARTARTLGRLPWLIRLFSYLPEGDPRRLGRRRPWSAVARLTRPSESPPVRRGEPLRDDSPIV
jgi:hypothetical protein